MSDPKRVPAKATDHPATLTFDYDLDASVESAWRAISSPEVREKWLPAEDLADPEPIHTVPGKEIRYRMRETEPPHLESVVTFRLAPGRAGGTRLTIIHDLTDARLSARRLVPANSDRGPVMLAA
ncbi:SRPBCC domain-containing protein [Thalassobaculum sp. OXR-137]|uniref:SRPBCC family protein n=1 Tax=Thalassobaculum sp. OXR-137 TaxID=3100173 RepID=UPI002AC8D5BE|nr:SRPBCC domain-containing protein [Thalassobaculum sp. OXR-137]WPZ35427.1 SRPBCC domain-containing protein [Thalassobaculum sp. OXR-137]